MKNKIQVWEWKWIKTYQLKLMHCIVDQKIISLYDGAESYERIQVAFCQKISLWCSQNLHQGLTSGNMCEIIWNWKPCCFLKRKCAICKWCVEWGVFYSNYFCCCLKRNSVLQVWIVLCKRKLMVALFVCASPSGWVWVVVGFLMQPRPPPPHTTSLYSLANNNDIKRWTLVQAPQPPLSK